MFFARESQESELSSSNILSFPHGNPQRTISIISTYLPRKCGLATFASDVVEHVGRYHSNIQFDIWAMSNADENRCDGVRQILANDPASYLEAARAINAAATDAVWLQHEFGIFGGPDGEMILDLIDRIAAPLIVTFHTVLEHPSDNQRRIIDHLVQRSSRIMVMSPLSRERLIAQHHAPHEITEVIEHGAPDRPFGREQQFKAACGLGNRPVLTTFGLLGPGKGLETVIQALPAILRVNPDICYRIVGATHPNLVASEGERYREGLIDLAEELGVAHAIEWENSFLDTDELLDQLEACDIYLTPYPNLQQSTSGTLSYAVALGKAVVSTPYIHAKELLADGVGILVEPQSITAIAKAVCSLLRNPHVLAEQKQRAYARGRLTIWPCFADAVASMIERTVTKPVSKIARSCPSFDAVRRMSDATGMLQHAVGTIADRRHGYCLDDNVRALMLTNITSAISETERADRASIFASFIQHAWHPEIGRFKNFMGFDRQWLEHCGSEDANGRAIWALAHTARNNPNRDIREWATRLYDQVLDHCETLDSPRTLAFISLGTSLMLKVRPEHGPSLKALERAAAILAHLLEKSRRPDWPWFEAVLAYDNPRLPQALIAAGQALDRKDWQATGLETLQWICELQTAAAGHFRPIGSEGFGQPFGHKPFDQQPLEAQAALEACADAYAATGDNRWVQHGTAAWNWFFGANDRGEVLADPDTGLCRDGLTPRGANLNCGAESILAFQLGYHSLMALVSDNDLNPENTVGKLAPEDARTLAYP
ncbi:MAG: glycosyltransferase family 4 protein [Blastomonas sp.]|uniref:glycosyltransferase family 4 protein n=1 Tax=Blastomonas sp. TaxID=1909299 RepID=UPI000B0149DB|nr:glycosyltransferase family 4 protein [Blastomonas sp.]